MNTEGYRVQKIDELPEVLSVRTEDNVEPFPTRRWNEPLPIAVEGRPLESEKEAPADKKSVARFYPPLLLFSTLLTGAFCYLYLTKPVIVEPTAPATQLLAATEASDLSSAAIAIEAEPVEDLMPFPDEGVLPGEFLPPGLSEEVAVTHELVPTSLSAEQVVQVESLNGELEEYSVSLPVFYPEGVLAWDDARKSDAALLTEEMELHLEQVRALQAEGIILLEKWNSLVESSKPTSAFASPQTVSTANSTN